MDRRTQRSILLILLFGVAVVLYRSLGWRDAPVVRHGGVGAPRLSGSGNIAGADFKLDLSGLEPANATLGVCALTED